MIKTGTKRAWQLATLKRAGLALGLVCTLAACGVTAPRQNEGFADLESLGVFDTDRTMAMSIGPTLIRIAVWATRETVGGIIGRHDQWSRFDQGSAQPGIQPSKNRDQWPFRPLIPPTMSLSPITYHLSPIT